MMGKDIKTQIEDCSIFTEYFRENPDARETFVKYAEAGMKMDKYHAMQLLIDEYMNMCGISITYRTVVFYAGSAIFDDYRQHDEHNRFGEEERFCEVMGLINPRYTPEYDEYDISYLKNREVIQICMEDMLPDLDEETKAALCYGLFLSILEQQNMKKRV
ncbi:MAG: hypothetical protein LBR10_01985 [Prevotellaceae bacterium]|jgi:hypothetical protein|nr:hypothetical protein [Prevotellaceae bacterium]